MGGGGNSTWSGGKSDRNETKGERLIPFGKPELVQSREEGEKLREELPGKKEKSPKLHKSPETLKREQAEKERKAQIKAMVPEAKEKVVVHWTQNVKELRELVLQGVLG